MKRSIEIIAAARRQPTARWMQGAGAVLAALLCTAAPAQSQTVAAPKYYEAKDLGAVAEQRPLGCIARNGTIGLTRQLDGSPNGLNDRAVVYGGPSDFLLFYLPGQDTWVRGCNRKNEFVGGYAGQAVIWDVDWTGPQILPTSKHVTGEALALNDKRQVVGKLPADIDGNDRVFYATVWNTSQAPGDAQVSVRTLFPGVAVAINNFGQVAATREDLVKGNRAMFVENGGASATPLLPAHAVSSEAAGISELGQLLGQYVDGSGRHGGFVWYHATYTLLWPARLGTTPQAHTRARAISFNGMVVVGQSYDITSQGVVNRRATVWPQAGTARDLNAEASMANGAPLSFTLIDAIGVADDGSVLCEGRTAGGSRRAVLLKPRVGGSWS